MALTVLLGGARSGKSSLAVEIGRRHRGPVTFVATAPAIDTDMTDRIARHRAERPASWTTIEEPADLIGALRSAAGSLVIIDCLTLWTSNLMVEGLGESAIDERARRTARIAADHQVVAVSNEVGLGVHPEAELGRRYRDTLGRVNQAWVDSATTSLLLVAGRAIELTDPWSYLNAETPRPAMRDADRR